MKLLVTLLVGLMFLGSIGCSQLNTPEDWERVTPTVARISEIALLTAFSRDDVQENKEEICVAVNRVADVLENIDDPTAAFDEIRRMAIAAVEEQDLAPELKKIVILVVDQVLDVTFMYVETYYNDLIQEDRVRIVVMVTRAVADGFRSACEGAPMTAGASRVFP